MGLENSQDFHIYARPQIKKSKGPKICQFFLLPKKKIIEKKYFFHRKNKFTTEFFFT